jgi:superfamily II DNA helicase RecQ
MSDINRDLILKSYKQLKQLHPHLPDRLREQQVQALVHLTNNKNVFAVLPTGFGKSLIYLLFPMLFDNIHSTKSAAVIISPLLAIMINQVDIWRKKGVSCVVVTKKENMSEADIKGNM